MTTTTDFTTAERATNVGFLYLEHPPIPTALFDEVVAYLPRFFELPQGRKEALRMANSPHFLGYSRPGVELTGGAADQREQFDIATPLENEDSGWTPGGPEYLRLWGPSQWPEEEDVPGFKTTFERYLAAVESLSYEFVRLVAEALGLVPDGLAQFFDARERMQHHAKLLLASDHPGLQAQNLSGQWTEVSSRPYTFVIDFGKGLESVTQGLVRATSHRVLVPPAGSSPRLVVPPEVLRLKGLRGELGQTDSVNFSEYDTLPFGQVSLISRVKLSGVARYWADDRACSVNAFSRETWAKPKTMF
ncbi:Clavaminate synthase-like protein [Lactarius pseudohatsudake]|nr:Clavaminate synthase-like protein [Lactarius pseudohatsudake]